MSRCFRLNDTGRKHTRRSFCGGNGLTNRIRWFVVSGVACLLTMLAGGCTYSGGGPCTGDVEPGVVVAVYAAQTRAPLASMATVTIQDGSYMETLKPFGFAGTGTAVTEVAVSGAYERPGTYTVNVTAPGYAPYVVNNVPVTKGVCHIKGVSLAAYLSPTISAN